MLDRCRAEERWATRDEQAVLARWSGWGAVPQVFDEADDRFATKRDGLRRLLGTEDAWAQARRTTLNAHYTSAEVVQAMWGAVAALGFDGGRVLEPGCGSGNFLGFAPPGTEQVGVELDKTTAGVAEHLYGARARIHVGGFEDLALPEGSFDLVIGNVPFAKLAPFDPRHNRSGHRTGVGDISVVCEFWWSGCWRPPRLPSGGHGVCCPPRSMSMVASRSMSMS